MEIRTLVNTNRGTPAPTANHIPLETLNPSPENLPAFTPTATPESQRNFDVRVNTDKTAYRVDETILVTVHNDSTASIFGLSGKTYCSIVIAQRKTEDGWQDEGLCGFAAGYSISVPIQPGKQLTVELSPDTRPEGKLPPGDYRIEFQYWIGSMTGIQETVYSYQFFIDDL